MENTERRPWADKYPQDTPKTIEVPNASLYSLLKKSVEKFKEQTAIIFKDYSMTYFELKDKVDRLASAWDQMGVKKGQRMGLMLSNHPDYIIAYYAAQQLGVIVVQINPMYTPREILEILHDSKAIYIVAEESNHEKLKVVLEDYTLQKIFISGELKEKENNRLFKIDTLISTAFPIETSVHISPKEDIAVIQYTGGTTGKMKGAMLTHYNIISNVLQSEALYGNKMKFGKETFLITIPLYHVFAMTAGMHLGIYKGARLLLFEKFEIEYVLKQIKEYRPTFFPGVPKLYSAFVNYPNIESYGLDCLKICSSGSAPLPVEIIKQFEKLTGATIGEGFGLSEASPSTHRNPPQGVRKIGSIGIPMPGTDSKIVDESDQELPANCVGELLIKGPQVMKGYWNKEDETNQALRNGWLYTGDLAMMDEDGYFYIVGRKKEMIIVGGFNIYPQEVESVLYEHPDIQEAAVVGIPVPDGDEMIKAYIVPKEGRTLDIEEVKGHCYRNLTRYKVPKSFESRETLPRNTVGKLLKRVLVEEEVQKINS